MDASYLTYLIGELQASRMTASVLLARWEAAGGLPSDALAELTRTAATLRAGWMNVEAAQRALHSGDLAERGAAGVQASAAARAIAASGGTSRASPATGPLKAELPDVVYWTTPLDDAAFSVRRDGRWRTLYRLQALLVRQLADARGRPVPDTKIEAFRNSSDGKTRRIVWRANDAFDRSEPWIHSLGDRANRAHFFWTPIGKRVVRRTIYSLDGIEKWLAAYG